MGHNGTGNHPEYFDRNLKRMHRDRAAWKTQGMGRDPLQEEVTRNLLDRLKDCKDKRTDHVVVLGGAGENETKQRKMIAKIREEPSNVPVRTHRDPSRERMLTTRTKRASNDAVDRRERNQRT